MDGYTGRCFLCESDVVFVKRDSAFRSLQCPDCKSLSRNRSVWHALTSEFPRWRDLSIHEGSSGWDRVSQRLVAECKNYTSSQYRDDLPLGELVSDTKLPCKKYFVQNFEKQTFLDEQFDVVVTQDVFEHIFDPRSAVREIARTLRPGGGTIMSVPVVRRFGPSQRRADLINGVIKHYLPEEYHGNPVGDHKSLVTIDWGYDIVAHFNSFSDLYFYMQTFDDIDRGIRDEFNQILVGRKRALPDIDGPPHV